MSTRVLQYLGVLVLAILFSLLFTSMNNREARNEKARLDGKKE